MSHEIQQRSTKSAVRFTVIFRLSKKLLQNKVTAHSEEIVIVQHFLFGHTGRKTIENVVYGNPKATDARLAAALSGFNGYDTGSICI
jgi:hypothetical protein